MSSAASILAHRDRMNTGLIIVCAQIFGANFITSPDCAVAKRRLSAVPEVPICLVLSVSVVMLPFPWVFWIPWKILHPHF